MNLDMRDCKICGFRYQPTGPVQKRCGPCRIREQEAVRQRRTAPRRCIVCAGYFTPGPNGRPQLCCSRSCLKKRANRLRGERFRDDPKYRERIRAINVAASRKHRRKIRKSKG